MPIHTKRIYDLPSPDDGYRLLVMRLWPRGISQSKVDAWERELAPSVDLLREMRSGAISWDEYALRYVIEVTGRDGGIGALEALRRRAAHETVTVMCSCKDASHCHRTLLRDLVLGDGPTL